MKTRLFLKRCTRSGYALLMVMVIIAVSLLLMASTLNRTYTVANLNNHSNQLILCQNAAEAAVEKVFARMQYDFQSGGGPATVANKRESGGPGIARVIPTKIPSGAIFSFQMAMGTTTRLTWLQTASIRAISPRPIQAESLPTPQFIASCRMHNGAMEAARSSAPARRT
jgi:hypothetical protein